MGGHARDIPTLLSEGDLVVAVLHVQDAPHLEGALALKDILNTRKGMGVGDDGVVDCRKSTMKRCLPSFFGTVNDGELQGLHPGSIFSWAMSSSVH